MTIGQQGPPLFVVDIRFARSGRRPGQLLGVEQSRLRGAAVGQHEGPIGENDALGVSDRAPAGGRSNRAPGVGDGVVDGSAVGPHRLAEVVFPAFDDHAAVGENGGRKIEGPISIGQRGDPAPGAVDVAAVAVGSQPPPFGSAGCVRDHRPIGQKERISGRERRLIHQGRPGLGPGHSQA